MKDIMVIQYDDAYDDDCYLIIRKIQAINLNIEIFLQFIILTNVMIKQLTMSLNQSLFLYFPSNMKITPSTSYWVLGHL